MNRFIKYPIKPDFKNFPPIIKTKFCYRCCSAIDFKVESTCINNLTHNFALCTII